MNTLVIDTSTNLEIIAARGQLFSDKTHIVDISHSRTISERIDSALREAGLNIKDINLIGVGIGPGSFTGIRIAVTTARMFAQILNIPIVGIKTHLIFALSFLESVQENENILIAFDAKKQRVFGALYRKSRDYLPQEIVNPGDYKIGYLAERINRNYKTVIIGVGIENHIEIINSCISNYKIIDNKPSGLKFCDLVEYFYNKNPGEFTDFNKILPFYSRKSDAEVMRNM